MFLKHIQTKSDNVLTDLFKKIFKGKKANCEMVIHDRLFQNPYVTKHL